MQENHLFCFGLGYSATQLAKDLLANGWRVSGTCRNTEKFPKLKTLGITPHIFDHDLPLDNLWDFNSVTHILTSIPPNEEGDIVLNYHLDDLKKLPDLKWAGYLSTTGVYGDHKGEWVDEETPTNPPNDRSRYRVEAENAWLESGLPVHIFRLAGIYGKGRSSIESLKNGTARRIDKHGQVFSRIHVEDIAQILTASIEKPNAGSIYNCADDLPCPQAEVVEYAAKLIGIKPPELIPFEQADLSPMARSFYMSNRRVSNKKIKDELGVKLKYPDYKSGLGGVYK
ncbi:MAG: NAD(P)-dependent oxidoreductase [Alphaproteobacteria bacterium CG11_big_fil_rev_8_21_14_0_20_39_49]|nr:MAG: NAD(P)-dependent oxidoreductase [Alphaproteobacteria bacterium CG11_big_fil_rev_8_21_14_0_20_39_49]